MHLGLGNIGGKHAAAVAHVAHFIFTSCLLLIFLLLRVAVAEQIHFIEYLVPNLLRVEGLSLHPSQRLADFSVLKVSVYFHLFDSAIDGIAAAYIVVNMDTNRNKSFRSLCPHDLWLHVNRLKLKDLMQWMQMLCIGVGVIPVYSFGFKRFNRICIIHYC